jgi:hypothetical protein
LLASQASHAEGAKPGATPVDTRVVPSVPAPVPAPDKKRAYVMRLYQDVLGRAGDPAKIDALVQMLSGGTSRDLVVLALLATEEYRALLVRTLYTRFLHRPATTAESQLMVSELGNPGATEERLTVTLASSPEYFHQRANDSLSTFVDQIFQDLFGGAPDASARGYFVAQLRAGTPRGVVVQSLLTSDDYASRVVQADCTKYLHRAPTSAEYGRGQDYVRGGHSSYVLEMFLGSQEYYDR